MQMPNIIKEKKLISITVKEGAACMTEGQNDTITPTTTPSANKTETTSVANKTEVSSISPTTKPEQTSAVNRLNITTLTSGPIDAQTANGSVNNVAIVKEINCTTV